MTDFGSGNFGIITGSRVNANTVKTDELVLNEQNGGSDTTTIVGAQDITTLKKITLPSNIPEEIIY